MSNTPLQDITQFQTDATIFDAFLTADANTEVDFSAAQDGSDMRPSLAMLLANMGLHPAANGACAAAQTSGALPANTYNNGASGVGATLTANANGVFPAADIDGVAPTVGLRVWLLANASNKAGIYVFTQVGDAGTPWILTRDTDADSAAELGYLMAPIAGGATQAGLVYLIPVSGADIVVGTTALPTTVLPAPPGVAAETARAEAAESAIEGGLSSCAATQAANFSPDGTAYLWPVNDNAGSIVVTIPAGAGFPNQKWKFIKTKNNANTVTITMSGADTLNGAATYVLNAQWQHVEIHNQRGSATWYGS